ncbi:Thiamine biosynthesis lipoprotein ApbE precursor [Anatilimnocola aggregata]|uniref:FAD:protein FMN transferase n=1 Tax=Anatilimnocola aggregata TaxID=2528021 RepID=A0A517YBH7_9BACT|nr:FAD:protein FMN transferase [Anatilimnocola aggregata]QDU27600.1 Thiamine biosynthesis lipoprotein ApbE precursor [Anatilimnocola aggregata]
MILGRRKLLLFAVGGASVGLLPWLATRRHSPALFTRTAWALGSDVSLSVAGLGEAAANRALDAAFAELETVEQVMSLYRPDSQISLLNRDRRLRDPHPYLCTVLQTAAATSRATAGAFDISVQPLWEVCAAAKRAGKLPTDVELACAKRKINWQRIEVGRDRVVFHEPVERITLNGIAQGFALDRAIAALKQQGAKSALINTGEIGSLGDKAVGDPWTAGIQHPRETDAYLAVADLDGRALATSGDYETAFSADFSRNHVFDPRTGDSPTELASVSIVAPTGLQADALSTAAMVLGKSRTLELIARLPNVDALLVDKAGRAFQTAGFPASAVA